MHVFVGLCVTYRYTVYTPDCKQSDSCCISPFRYRLMVTQLYTWQLVSMVTPTRRRSCGCCLAEELIPVPATWRTTSQLTCCRVDSRESRWAAHHFNSQSDPYRLVLLFQFLSRVIHYHIIFSFLAQAHAEETKRFLSSTYGVLAGPGMIQITCNPHLEGMSLKDVASVEKGIYSSSLRGFGSLWPIYY